jgi:putative N6-adenine-specific DNA methylase
MPISFKEDFIFSTSMNLFMTKRLLLLVPRRLACTYLGRVKDLGFTNTEKTFVTGVRIYNFHQVPELNLNLRCTSQVLYSLKNLKQKNADAVIRTLLVIHGKIFCDRLFSSPAM